MSGLGLARRRQAAPSSSTFGAMNYFFPAIGALLTPVSPDFPAATYAPVAAWLPLLTTGATWAQIPFHNRAESPPPLAQRLTHILSLPPDWDSYGSASISRSAAEIAVQLLGKIPPDLVTVAPQLVPTPEGGIQVEWHGRGLSIELEIMPSGELQMLIADSTSGRYVEGRFLDHLPEFAEAFVRLR